MPVAGSASNPTALSPRSLPGLTAWWDAGAITRKQPNEVAGLQAWYKAEDAGQILPQGMQDLESGNTVVAVNPPNDVWTSNTPADMDMVRSTEWASSGRYSMKATTKTGGAGTNAIYTSTAYDFVSGDTITLSAWVYNPNSTTITVTLGGYLYQGTGTFIASTFPGGGSFNIPPRTVQRVAVSIPWTGSTNDHIRLVISTGLVVVGTSIYVDDISAVNDHVASWPDSSGHGYNLSQTTIGKRPVLAQNVSNGKPGVLFDGTDDYLQTATFGSAIAQPASVFLVVKRTNALTIDTYIDGIANTFMIAENTTQLQGNFGLLAANGTTMSTSPTIISCTTDAGLTDKMYLNGVLNWGPADGGSNSLDGLTLGIKKDLTTDPLIGHIMEVVIFSGALSDADRQAVELYLANKYGIGTAVASLPDLVGSNALVQATDAKKPLYTTNVAGGRPGIKFDNVDDHLLGGTPNPTIPQPLTMVVVTKLTALHAAYQMSLCDAGATPYIASDGPTDQPHLGGDAGIGPSMAAATDTNPHILIGICDGANARLWLDGVDGSHTTTGVDGFNGNVLMGAFTTTGTNQLDGSVLEAMIFNRALSDSDRLRLQRYLGNKYGITVA